MTFGLVPKAAHISQNWYNLTPTGQSIATTGTFVTFRTKLTHYPGHSLSYGSVKGHKIV